jgi:hypothetical protein
MIFICGCGHSGTSLVAAMLGSHKEIYAINEETALFTKLTLTNGDIRALIRERYKPLALEKGASFICEKTPLHIHHLPRIRAAFPGAQIVIPVRDARDVALSIRRRIGSLEVGYLRWARDNAVVQREHAAKSADTLIFRYEDLIDDIEGILGTICRRLGLPYDPMMMEYYRDERTWFGAPIEVSSDPPDPKDHVRYRNWQIKQPIMERRGHWRTQLGKREIAMVQGACGQLMEYFGYTLERALSAD